LGPTWHGHCNKEAIRLGQLQNNLTKPHVIIQHTDHTQLLDAFPNAYTNFFICPEKAVLVSIVKLRGKNSIA